MRRRDDLDMRVLRGRPVTAEGLDVLQPGTVVKTPDGRVQLAYVQLWLPGDPLLEALRAALPRMQVRRTYRASTGTWQNSGYFGSQPRQHGTTHDYCRAGEIDGDTPREAGLLYRAGQACEHVYRQMNPAGFAHHAVQAERIAPAWRAQGLRCFTGGVVNRDNPITWHLDKGNFAHTWSAMPVVRHGMKGGELAVPELGVVLPCADGTAVFFDGQSLVHGVTPLRRTRRGGHRFSVVFYATQALWQCLPPAAEVGRMQASRTERELRRAQGGPVGMDERQRAALGRP